ncbi:3'-5' exonuclease [Evansella tamaricis]|uniref:3'-5' exonuclease n=1 Tax=Evansella tamaricis TaxID=2069301 RepID=UPI0031B82F9C
MVFDLELVKRFRKGQLSEIVEIGACKVDLQQKKIVDELQIYILPNSGYISKSTRKFINMTKEDMKKAVPFYRGMEEFIHWLGEEYYLCSWGRDDKVHLMDQCLRNKMEVDWIKNFNNIQPQISRIIGKATEGETNEQLGLKNALQLAQIEPIGKAHRGIDDTLNTTQLFLKYIDDITLAKSSITIQEIKRHKYKARQRRLLHKKKTTTEKK